MSNIQYSGLKIYPLSGETNALLVSGLTSTVDLKIINQPAINNTITNVLVRDGSGNIFLRESTTLGATTATTLSNLTDTTITSPVDGNILKYRNGTWVNLSKVNLYFTSTDGQTYFTNKLPSEPSEPTKSEFFINGVKQRYGLSYDYVLSGGTNRDFVWVTNKHILTTIDELNVKYF